ncbi:MAG: nicotinamide mononucleotide transporter [Ruminococcaceae bacterium]|nr:nicotinamide mononucleotide transporter [Oscillospiraceae bacterium]
MLKKLWNYFSGTEKLLWSGSVLLIVLSFIWFGSSDYMTLTASLVGVTSLIFCAKGNPVGQVLMILFSMLYGVISYQCAYYGEMITYLGMTGPMAGLALIAWLRNPFGKGHSQVAISSVSKKELLWMILLSIPVTVGFYFLLDHFHTAHLLLSTLSVFTSFVAVYLTFRRSPLFALAYAANDVVLIALWVLAAREEQEYLAVVVCFAAFLVNDIYGYLSWRRMYAHQRELLRNKAP